MKSAFSAQQSFQQLDRLQLAPGLTETTLMNYVSLLGEEKKWMDAIRPLVVIIAKQGGLHDDAILRLAQIQLRVLSRPDQAVITLQKIVTPDEEQIDEAKRERLVKRDELMATARRIAGM